MANYQNILRQAHQAIADVADNADSWRAFLRSAAYTTHYAFPNQALIYSQRPGATMLADIDTWNRAAGRWVNRGAHGVASLGTGNMAGNVRYLFDIKDTHPAGKDSKPLGWQITDANRYPTLQALQEKHNAESLPEIFGLQAALFVAQHGKQLDADLQNAVIGSTLEWAKPQEQTAIFANLITQSAVYMAAVRCGLGDSAVPQDAFADIDRFDTESAVLALGNAVNRAGRQMFAEIGAVVKSIDSVAKTQPKQYDENVSKTNQIGIFDVHLRDEGFPLIGRAINRAEFARLLAANPKNNALAAPDTVVEGQVIEETDTPEEPSEEPAEETSSGFGEQVLQAAELIALKEAYLPNNYIPPQDPAPPRTPREKFAANITAIRTLKSIEKRMADGGPHANGEEQEILAQYSGWGGLSDAFEPNKDSWHSEYTELKSLLTEEEYAAARSSTLTAFYTPPEVIDAMYTALRKMGVGAGTIRSETAPERSHLWALFYWRDSMDIETLLIKAEQDGCMVVLNDIAPNRERSELVFRVPESVYDTPVAALDIDESTKSALQKQKITVLEHLLHRLAVGRNAAKQLHIAQDAAEQVVNAVIETAYRSLSEPEKRNFWERMEELPGAELTITDKDGKEIDRWVSTDKPHYIEKLPAGDYTLTEVKTPDGYATAEIVPFTVLPTGEVQRFEMLDDVIKVEISKKDLTTMEELPGAELTITDKDGKKIDRWVSTDKPHYIEKLPAGDYTLTEVKAPDGYAFAESVPFTVLPTGEVQRFEMRDNVIKVEISKVDITTNKELPGAELIITNKDGKKIDRWVSTDKPHYIEKLPAGEYTLTEITAPDGYDIAESIRFTVLPTGEVQTVVMKDARTPERTPQPEETPHPTETPQPTPSTTPAPTPAPQPIIPQTGDTFPLGLLLTVAGISLAGLAVLIFKCVHCKSVAEHDDETK